MAVKPHLATYPWNHGYSDNLHFLDLSSLATASYKVPETLRGVPAGPTCAHRQAPLATAVKFPFNLASPSPRQSICLVQT